MDGKANGRAYYTPNEAAEKLGVSPSAIYTWIKTGYLEAKKAGPRPGSPWRIPADVVDRMAAETSV